MKPVIAIHGNYYDENFGDLLLLNMFKEWIGQITPLEIVYLNAPDSMRAVFRRENVFFESYDPSAHRLAAVVIGGGGHFGENRSPNKIVLGEWEKRLMKRHVWPLIKPRWNNIPMIYCGIEAGPITNIPVKHIFRYLVGQSSVSVRNVESNCFLQSMGIESVVGCDPVFSKEFGFSPACIDLTPSRLVSAHKHLIGLHHPRDLIKIDKIVYILKEFSSRVGEVTYVLLSDNACNEPVETLADLLLKNGLSCVTSPFRSVSETLAGIAKLSGVVTTKLHVGIVAMSLRIPTVSLCIHQKTARMYRDLGQSSRCLSFDAARTKQPAELVAFIAKHLFHVESEIRESEVVYWQSSARVHVTRLKEFLGSVKESA